MDDNWRNYIESTPEVLRGKPRIAGTRVPVSLILGHLAEGATPEQIQAEYPDISAEQISACLHFARALAEPEVAST